MNEKDQPTPEQLLKLLDVQMEASRKMRATKKDSRSTMRILSLAIIVLATVFALWVLMAILEEMRPQRGAESPRPVSTQPR